MIKTLIEKTISILELSKVKGKELKNLLYYIYDLNLNLKSFLNEILKKVECENCLLVQKGLNNLLLEHFYKELTSYRFHILLNK